MRTVAVLQARLSSSRLPSKVLLPVAGLPLAVLAAKRAANAGRHVILATSVRQDDDKLAEVAAQYGVHVFRGSLEDTLGRVAAALSGYDRNDLVFRLTADNVFPDGHLLDQLEQEFLERDLDYLACNGAPSGVPYGMSAELTKVGHLRTAAAEASEPYDREHVTPFVIRRFGATYFRSPEISDCGHLRCTVDYREDYARIQKVFARVQDPIHAPCAELVRILAALGSDECAGES